MRYFRWVFTTSNIASSVISVADLSLGNSLSDSWIYLEPSHQVEQLTILWPVIPREGTPAGFNEPGQCLHSSLVVNRRIFVTR